MKKLLSYICILLMVFCLCGCVNDSTIIITIKAGIREQIIEKHKIEKLEIEEITIVPQSDIIGLYYDENYTNAYKGIKILNDICIHVKVKEGSIAFMSVQLEDEINDLFSKYYSRDSQLCLIMYYFGEYYEAQFFMTSVILPDIQSIEVVEHDISFKYLYFKYNGVFYSGMEYDMIVNDIFGIENKVEFIIKIYPALFGIYYGKIDSINKVGKEY